MVGFELAHLYWWTVSKLLQLAPSGPCQRLRASAALGLRDSRVMAIIRWHCLTVLQISRLQML